MAASVALVAAVLLAIGSLETDAALSTGLLVAAVAAFVVGAGLVIRGGAEHQSTQDVPERLGEGSDMIPKVREEGPRAKALRPGDSGVFRAVHAADNATLTGACPTNDPQDPVPVQGRSVRRAGMQRALAALLGDALRVDGLSDADAGAACDRQRRHVVDMRQPDGRAITGADVVLIARVSPAFRAALVDLIGGAR